MFDARECVEVPDVMDQSVNWVAIGRTRHTTAGADR